MKTFSIIILLSISSFHYLKANEHDDNYFDKRLEIILAILKSQFQEEYQQTIFFSGNKQHSNFKKNSFNDYESQVDPNDRVHVKLWNKLNAEDIKNMPIIDDYSSEALAIQWLQWYQRVSKRYYQVSSHLSWNYQTNLTEYNRKALTAQSLIKSPFSKLTLPMAKKFNEYMKNSTNEDLKRIFYRLALGTVSHNKTEIEKSSALHSELEDIYATTKVCESNNSTQCYTLAPYLERLMQIEKDYDRLVWAWQGWHDGCGNRVRPVYLSYIDILNKKAKDNGFQDLSEEWIKDYEMGESNEFEGIIDQLLKDVKPLYEQLHAYVRGRLCSMYPGRFNCHGPIPAHLLGNMWAQTWHDRFDDLIPYPDAPLINITEALLERKFTIHQMYTTAESFFTSIGLYPMTPKFWARSLFKKPTDRHAICHGAAANMQYHDDYRVRICTEINDDHFYTIHHEMGHIEYYMAYNKKQPFIYRSGANSGFHEAIGDTIGIFAISPSHLVKLGFLDEDKINAHYEINFLLRLALQKVAFLPFSYVMDKYRFKLFRNQIDREHELNSMWWALRIEHGGIMAASPRNDKDNFDAGAKFHIPANVPYLRYFIAHILQFQFYRAMCRLQGVNERFHMCDIYGNKYAGQKFKEMLSMGDSQSWPDILQILTGETKLESSAILDFFQPLYEWLKEENRVKGYPVGWL